MTKAKTIAPLLVRERETMNRRPRLFKRGKGRGERGEGWPRFKMEYSRIRPTHAAQVRVINRDNPCVMQHSLTTLSSIALLRTDDLAHNVQISSIYDVHETTVLRCVTYTVLQANLRPLTLWLWEIIAKREIVEERVSCFFFFFFSIRR